MLPLLLFFKDFIYLFVYLRGRETGIVTESTSRGNGGEREAGSLLSKECDMGLDPIMI